MFHPWWNVQAWRSLPCLQEVQEWSNKTSLGLRILLITLRGTQRLLFNSNTTIKIVNPKKNKFYWKQLSFCFLHLFFPFNRERKIILLPSPPALRHPLLHSSSGFYVCSCLDSCCFQCCMEVRGLNQVRELSPLSRLTKQGLCQTKSPSSARRPKRTGYQWAT